MKHANFHARLLGLLCLLLVGIPLLLAGSAALLAPQSGIEATGAFDQIVPGMTRAEDLASFGIDIEGGEALSSAQIAQRFASAGPRERACIEAGAYCTGYLVASSPAGGLFARFLGRPAPTRLVVLVMNGRVVDKVLPYDAPDAAPAPGLRVASASAF